MERFAREEDGHRVRRRAGGRPDDRRAAEARAQELTPRSATTQRSGTGDGALLLLPTARPTSMASATLGSREAASRRRRPARARDRAVCCSWRRSRRCSSPRRSSSSSSTSRTPSSSTSRSRPFLTDTMWTPLFADPRYGILPLLCGTLLSTAVALCRRRPARPDRRDLSERVRPPARARDRQADPGAPERRPDRRLRLLRAAVRDAAAADDHPRACRRSTC